MRIKVKTTFQLLSEMVEINLTEQNLEYWRTHSEFREFSSEVYKDYISLEIDLEDRDIANILNLLKKHRMTYELIRS